MMALIVTAILFNEICTLRESDQFDGRSVEFKENYMNYKKENKHM